MKYNNPYTDSKFPRTKLSLVVYLDVLGIKEQIKESYKNKKPTELLKILRATYNDAIEHLKDRGEEGRGGHRLWEIKAFTDNIVIGFPIFDDGEGEMGSTFFNLSLFQLELIKAGFFLRGVISVGEHYMDNELVFGEAILEAYEHEQTIARDPRIVLSSSAVKFFKHHLSYYGDVQTSPQYRDILKDADGIYFLNYLDVILIEDYLELEELMKHRNMVEQKLREYKNHPRIWSKYAWVANYHNYFCNQYDYVDDTYKIDASYFQIHPQRLDE